MDKAIPAQPGDIAVQLLPWEAGSQDIGAHVEVLGQCSCLHSMWRVVALCDLKMGAFGIFAGHALAGYCPMGDHCCLPKRVLFKKQKDDPITQDDLAINYTFRSKEFSR